MHLHSMIVRPRFQDLACLALITAIAGSTASAQVLFDEVEGNPANPVAAHPFFEGAPELGASPRAIHLRSGAVSTMIARTDLANDLDRIKAAGARHIIQLDGPMTKERREQIENAGLRIGGYLPVNAFIVDATNANAEAVGALGFIRWHSDFEAAWKLDPALEADWAKAHPMSGPGEAAVTVTLFQNADIDAFLESLNNFQGATAFIGGMVGDNYSADVILKRSDLPALAALNSVNYIEPALEATERNNSTTWIIQSNVSGFRPLYDNGLHGEGQVLGHMDGRVNSSHCSFRDTNPIGPTHRKILAYNTTSGYDLHGTHTACTAVGNQDPSVDNNTRGIAYEAKLCHNTTPSFSETAFTNNLQLHHDQGARVHTNSWGNDGSTSYNAWTRAIDVFSHDEEDSLVCFAVTNLSSLKTPENAKNVLAVGASQDSPSQASFCSGGQGPTSDGRRKPEIYAPGCNTQSASGSGTSCSTTGLTGTSMACPAISGLGLLVRQYYTDGFYPTGAANAPDAFTPTGALIKATLINGAQDMTGIAGYPSAREGWGRANGDAALFFLGDARTLIAKDIRNSAAEAMGTGGLMTFDFNVTGSAEQLRLTMCFTDKEGGVSASFAPVNDLDLEVSSPSGTIYKGNVFSGGVSTSGGSADAINNLEQIHINSPETGVWTARVSATAVNSAEDQGFALVITGEVNEQSAPVCAWDLNGDGVTDTADLGILIDAFGAHGMGLPADLNGDMVVDTSDLGVLLGHFGETCE
ncbi:MAG: S8 family serine peptidase [Phycisphaeraceae bacterium]|nr:S8 family serine peptidase [Phycisphaeraceae bacterium]MCB9847238.1 S8 family serine peptidase [Phycisphaeraceae bacterium]